MPDPCERNGLIFSGLRLPLLCKRYDDFKDWRMKDHYTIDQRGLALAHAIVAKIEQGDVGVGIATAQEVNARWRAMVPSALHDEWQVILATDWETIKQTLLCPSEYGQRLRQNNPFCGILTPQERWKIFEEYRQYAA